MNNMFNPYGGMPMNYGAPAPGTPIGAYNQQYGSQQPAKPQFNMGINWVSSIDEINKYDIPIGYNAVFFDSMIDGRYYVKACDSMGRPQLMVFDSTEITNNFTQTGIDMSNYVIKADFDKAMSELENTRTELNQILESLGGQNNGKQSVQQTQPAASASFSTAVDDAIRNATIKSNS